MSKSHGKLIPLAFATLSAGSPAPHDDGYALLDLNEMLTGGHEGSVIAYVVTGESMREDILPGYIVFINTFREPRNGDTVAVSINNETCIKIFERDRHRLYLVPKNDGFPTREIRPTDTFHLIGVVTSHLAVY
jgi:SOS-response transcriptional repressor LexA